MKKTLFLLPFAIILAVSAANNIGGDSKTDKKQVSLWGRIKMVQMARQPEKKKNQTLKHEKVAVGTVPKVGKVTKKKKAEKKIHDVQSDMKKVVVNDPLKRRRRNAATQPTTTEPCLTTTSSECGFTTESSDYGDVTDSTNTESTTTDTTEDCTDTTPDPDQEITTTVSTTEDVTGDCTDTTPDPDIDDGAATTDPATDDPDDTTEDDTTEGKPTLEAETPDPEDITTTPDPHFTIGGDDTTDSEEDTPDPTSTPDSVTDPADPTTKEGKETTDPETKDWDTTTDSYTDSWDTTTDRFTDDWDTTDPDYTNDWDTTTDDPRDPTETTTALEDTTNSLDEHKICAWSHWGAWSSCNCRDGVRSRIRKLKKPADDCQIVGCGREIKNCHRFPCPIDCVPSHWSTWSVCRGSCFGVGTRRRHRYIRVPALYGGRRCHGGFHEHQECPVENRGCGEGCPVGEWQAWNECQLPDGFPTCNCDQYNQQFVLVGQQTRQRFITGQMTDQCPSLFDVQPCDYKCC